MFETNQLYLHLLNTTEDIIVSQGGTWSGKTYSILQALFSRAITEEGTIITVTGEDIPNLRRGCLRDALTIYNSSKQLQLQCNGYNATNRTFRFKNGSVMEFVSFENEQDARNGKRDYLFINEAQGLHWQVAEQLITRTRKQTFVDYNPSVEFWVHEKLVHPQVFGSKKVKLFISQHRNNYYMQEEQHEHILQRSGEDPEWGQVYALGETGKVEGLILPHYKRVAVFPPQCRLVAYGLDFGFTNDPTALVEVRMQEGELFVKLLIYETGLTNPAIGERMERLGVTRYDPIVADSAEPKSIAELRHLGWYMEGAEKGRDSLNNSIDILKRYGLNIVGSSPQLIDELNNYQWKTDKVTGQSINEPVDFMNHAIDALRYVALNKLGNSGYGEYFIV